VLQLCSPLCGLGACWVVCNLRVIAQHCCVLLVSAGFWPPVCSCGCGWFVLFCCRVIACASHAKSMLRSFSEKVTKLKTELVSVVEASVPVCVLFCDGVFFGTREVLDALVAVILKVEIDLVDSRSSCIFAIVLAGVVVPDMSISTLVSGKMRSMSNVSIFAISWSALVTMLRVLASHQASFECSIAPSVKNLLSFVTLITPPHRPVKKTRSPATTSHACWLLQG